MTKKRHFPLQQYLEPVPSQGGFHMEDYWVWDGSVIRGEDDRFHLFATRWPKRYELHPSWLFLSEVVRASADAITGPYTFEEVVLPQRASTCFDGKMTHNPSIRKVGDTYLLFYIGVTYEKPFPEDPAQAPDRHDPWYREVWLRKRIGLATSKSVFGPWERSDRPIVDSRPGYWDAGTSSNPSPFIMPDGSIYLAYKSSVTEGQNFNIGIARAQSYNSAFERVSDKPVFQFEKPESFVEDPFLWHADGVFHIIVKDMTGDLTGELGRGLYAWSEDAVNWTLGDPPLAYTRDLDWDTGQREHLGQVERMQLLLEDGHPTHCIAAIAHGQGDMYGITDSRVAVIPMKPGL